MYRWVHLLLRTIPDKWGGSVKKALVLRYVLRYIYATI